MFNYAIYKESQLWSRRPPSAPASPSSAPAQPSSKQKPINLNIRRRSPVAPFRSMLMGYEYGLTDKEVSTLNMTIDEYIMENKQCLETDANGNIISTQRCRKELSDKKNKIRQLMQLWRSTGNSTGNNLKDTWNNLTTK